MKNFFALTSLIYCLLSFTVHAQDNYSIRKLNDMANHYQWSQQTKKEYADIDGSPYLNDEFQEGDVYSEGKYKFEAVPLRYNLYQDEFEFKSDNSILVFKEPEAIDKIIIGSEEFIYLSDSAQQKVNGYVKKWNDQFPAVLTKMKTTFQKKEEPKPYTEPKPDRFERAKDKHYLMINEAMIERITSVKKLIKMLGDHENELASFAKKEKISADNPVELSKIVEFFHQLNSRS